MQQVPGKFRKIIKAFLKPIPLDWKAEKGIEAFLDIYNVPKLKHSEINNLKNVL